MNKYWLILSCYHWYKWTGDNASPDKLKCIKCRRNVEVLDKVPVTIYDY